MDADAAYDIEYSDEQARDVLYPLVTVDSDMFICRVSDNINLDVYQFGNDGNLSSSDVIVDTFGIENFASNIFGKHDCTLKNKIDGLNSNMVQLTITKEANTQASINVNSQFKGEIHTKVQLNSRLPSNEKLVLHCPNSGSLFEIFYLLQSIHSDFSFISFIRRNSVHWRKF